MAQRATYEAADKKLGMSLEELHDAVSRAYGLAETNGTDTTNAKVKVQINFGGGLKEITVEV
jgi:hypothetical protein